MSCCFGGREREGGADTFLLCGIGVQVLGDRANTALSYQPAGAGGRRQGTGEGCCTPGHRMLTCPAEPRSFQPRERPPRLPPGGDPAAASWGRGGQTVFSSAPRARGCGQGAGSGKSGAYPGARGSGQASSPHQTSHSLRAKEEAGRGSLTHLHHPQGDHMAPTSSTLVTRDPTPHNETAKHRTCP